MYRPRHFDVDDRDQLHAWMGEYSFATLISHGADGIVATHLPAVVVPEGSPNGTIRAHMARANDHWRHFDGATEALAIFAGPHAYVSPTWYASSPAVPTWDYIAVHAYGTPRVVEDEARVLATLHELVRANESGRDPEWRLDSQPEEYVRRLAQGIVAFEMPISRLEGKAKLGQNRPAEQPAVAAALAAEGHESLARAILLAAQRSNRDGETR